MKRTVFVISDLHLGGELPSPRHPRGFRICSQADALAEFIAGLPGRARGGCELVINGDFVDFLAEKHGDEYLPFIDDDVLAESTFRNIVGRNESVFRALRDHVAAGHRLTILSGNHDVELSYPRVRTALREVLRDDDRVRIQTDGRPYHFANAVIEHGHAHDGWNAIPPERLVALIERGDLSAIPPGSRLVSTVMNRVKETFPFVDLLKPEQESVVPVLLALDPSQARNVGRVLLLAIEAARAEHRIERARGLVPISGRERADAVPGLTAEEAVQELLAELLAGDAAAFSAEVAHEGRSLEPVTDRTGDEVLATLALLVGSSKRRRALLRALRVVQRDLSFVQHVEQDERYEAACTAYDGAVKLVVMGHTHLAKDVMDLGAPGRRYINTGTWADLIPFPELTGDDEAIGAKICDELVDDLAAARTDPLRLERWVAFRPNYCRLECEDDVVRSASLELFEERAREPARRSVTKRSAGERPT